jgi:nitrogen-specific signal transduction histidine kinase
MTMTEKLTASKVLALARKKHGKAVELRENKNAPDAATRDANRAKVAGLREAIARLKEEIRWAGDVLNGLREAARFALDVDGDEPSWTQLRQAAEAAERVQALREEMREAEAEKQRLTVTSHHYRWRLRKYTDSPLGPIGCVVAMTDTLEELVEKAKLS